MTRSSNSNSGLFYGISTLLVLALITTICFIPIFLLGLLKLIPNQKWRIYCTKQVDRVAVVWTGLTTGYVNRFYPIHLNITGIKQFDPQQWYLVVANHQSWLDTILLQNIFHHKIPVIKFFIKEQLKWIPLLGFSWWAMGCPFMKRYSKEYIKKNPHKKHKDIESTHNSLKLFKSYPSTIMSFIEGTRYTTQKKRDQQSPYEHLLKPKAGGISLVISALGKQLQPILDVTIVYPTEKHSLWDFLCRRIDRININIRSLVVPDVFTQSSTALEDDYTQNTFRAWLNDQWAVKDALISEMKHEAATGQYFPTSNSSI